MNEIVGLIKNRIDEIVNQDFPKEGEFIFFESIHKQIIQAEMRRDSTNILLIIYDILNKDAINGKKIFFHYDGTFDDPPMVQVDQRKVYDISFKICDFEVDIPKWFQNECICLYEREGLECIPMIFDAVDRYYIELTKQEEKYQKYGMKLRNNYEKVLDFLAQMDVDTYISIPFFIYEIENITIFRKIISYITEKNHNLYHAVKQQNMSIHIYQRYESVMSQYGYSLEIFSREEKQLLFDTMNCKQLDRILSLYSELPFTLCHLSKENILYLLLNTEVYTIKDILQLISDKQFTNDFFKSHMGLFVEQTRVIVNHSNVIPLYNRFKANLNFLSSLGNFEYMKKNNPTIFLLSLEELQMNKKMADSYGIQFIKENVGFYTGDILKDSKYFDYVDEMIELGFYEYVKIHPECIKDSTPYIITRLTMMRAIGADIMNEHGRLQSCITSGKNFYVKDDELEQYRIHKVEENTENMYFQTLHTMKRDKIDDTVMSLEMIQYLDMQYKYSEYEYRIDDIIISRLKVLRNAQALLTQGFTNQKEIVFFAMLYHAKLTKEQMMTLENVLSLYDKKSYQKKI